MKTVFVMMDSLNRHFLPTYGGWALSPNIDRLAERGIVFDNHYCGSLPCIPARREMMTGRHNFLEAPWGPIEPWDDCLPLLLRKQRGVYSHMITDHYHYFHSGGEGYHTLFSSWEFERGQEGDVWRALAHGAEPPRGARGKGVPRTAYWNNRAFLDPERDQDYSTPRCFQRAIEFLDRNHDADGWHLHLEAFDPHEPFDCPSRYREMYEDTWDRYFYSWPEYGRLDPELDDEEAVAHIAKSYAGTLTMADHWLGRLLDRFDELDLWRDTTLIFSTDHGHLLGEHGYWAKSSMMDYAELARIPLIVCPAGGVGAGRRVPALTATMDLMPTLLDLHGARPPEHVHGRSFRPLLEGTDGPHHDAVLYGYFGKDINLTDGRYTYCRQPEAGSVVHHHTAMPRGFTDFLAREELAAAETGLFLPYSHGIPHLRIPRRSHRHLDAPGFNPIYDLQADPGQSAPIRDPELERRFAHRMRELMIAADAPGCQYDRVGLPRPA